MPVLLSELQGLAQAGQGRPEQGRPRDRRKGQLNLEAGWRCNRQC